MISVRTAIETISLPTNSTAPFEGFCSGTYRPHRCVPNSHSFSYNKEPVPCCTGCNHHTSHNNGRNARNSRMHHGACNIL